jgi:LysR family nitrogen assimilation transcriptional regulator
MRSLQELRVFVAVYEEGSFTAAAAREHATQSGVSHHIQKLESQLETPLFLRGAGVGVKPTPAGNVFYRYALEAIRKYESAMISVLDFGRGLHGEITVGLIPTINRSILPGAVVEFMRMHPNVNLAIVEDLSRGLVARVREGELGFALGVVTVPAAGVRCRPFARWPCSLVSGRQSPLTPMRPVRLAELPALHLIAARSPNAVRAAIEAYLAVNGVEVERLLELDSIDATLGIISESQWSSILPGPSLINSRNAGELILNPITDPPLFVDIVVIERFREPLTPIASAFIEALQQQNQQSLNKEL